MLAIYFTIHPSDLRQNRRFYRGAIAAGPLAGQCLNEGHPAWVALIQALASKRVCISGNIAAELPLSRTTVSHYLQELKALDLIRGEIEGLTVCYCLNTELLQRIQQQFTAFFSKATSGGACAC